MVQIDALLINKFLKNCFANVYYTTFLYKRLDGVTIVNSPVGKWKVQSTTTYMNELFNDESLPNEGHSKKQITPYTKNKVVKRLFVQNNELKKPINMDHKASTSTGMFIYVLDILIKLL